MKIKLMHLFLPWCVIGIFFLNLATAAQKRTVQAPLVGTFKVKLDGFGCYFVPPEDIDKRSDLRRYLFTDDDDGVGTMKIAGRSVRLKIERAYEVKSRNKKFVWIYADGNTKVRFDLTQTETTNEGSNVHYDAVITVQKGAQKRSIKAKGFCGG